MKRAENKLFNQSVHFFVKIEYINLNFTMRTSILLAAFFFLFTINLQAQESVLVTGQTVDAESFEVLPLVNVRIKGKGKGVPSNEKGEFSLRAASGDTLIFSEVGYQESYFFLPPDAEKSYDIIKLMRRDTIMLPELIISNLPSEDRFREIFLAHSTDPNEKAMRKGYQAFFVNFRQQQGLYDKQLQGQYFRQLTGIDPVNDWINPVRWVQFVKEVQAGKYRDALPVTEIDWIEKD